MHPYHYLDVLEAEAIYILRETAAQFKNPALLFSGGKDSITVLKLAEKAFYPGTIPFTLVHIDTGHNFEEVLSFRDELIQTRKEKFIIAQVQETIDSGKAKETEKSRNQIQSITLIDTIQAYQFDACIGGARRDEEKARAKERIFSLRNAAGQWMPEQQRPEIWAILNGKIHEGENMRIFPISNWTELDVWHYIQREKIKVPSIYFAHKRKCILKKEGSILAYSPHITLEEGDQIEEKKIRFRTVGDITCTAALLSEADSINKVIEEVKNSTTGERSTRVDDQFSEFAMEKRKKEGYF